MGIGFYIGNQQEAYDAELFAIMRGIPRLASRHWQDEIHYPDQFTGSNRTHPVRRSKARARHGNRNHRSHKHAVRAGECPNNKMGPRPLRKRRQRGSRRNARDAAGLGISDIESCMPPERFFPQECKAVGQWLRQPSSQAAAPCCIYGLPGVELSPVATILPTHHTVPF